MDITIFLGKALGFYLVITSLVLFFRKKALRRIINNTAKSDEIMPFFFGTIIIIIGLLWVLSHNIWDSALSSIISIFAWITLAKGVVYLASPLGWFKGVAKRVSGSLWFTIWPIIGFGFGIYLLNQTYLWF